MKSTASLIIVLLLTLSTLAIAQPSNAGTGARGDLETDSYLLKPGDKLEIYINALPDLESKYEIGIDGGVLHSVVGLISTSGLTLSDLRAEFGSRLKKELRHPSFRLGLSEISQHQVAVLGEAVSQGTYQVGIDATALDLLAIAGGLGEKADRERAVILRGTEQIEISLTPEAGQGLTVMKAGDVLYIQAGSQVSVAGEVTEPGAYSVSKASGSPWDAIIAAGGAKEEAALSRVKLIRPTFSEPLRMDLRPEAIASLPEAARTLLPGDIILVPSRQAAVLGAVKEPGPVPLVKKVTLIDVLSTKLTSESDVKHIFIIRAKDVYENRENKEVYNLEKFFKDGEGDVGKVSVYDGDLVYVPDKGKGSGGMFSKATSIFSILNIARLFF